jgi:hypothetical protein
LFVIPNLIWDPEPQRRASCRDAALLDPDFHQDDEEECEITTKKNPGESAP